MRWSIPIVTFGRKVPVFMYALALSLDARSSSVACSRP